MSNPGAANKNKGETCRAAMGSSGYLLVAVYWVHCVLFLVYVWMMLSITYYSFLKNTFVSKATDVA